MMLQEERSNNAMVDEVGSICRYGEETPNEENTLWNRGIGYRFNNLGKIHTYHRIRLCGLQTDFSFGFPLFTNWRNNSN